MILFINKTYKAILLVDVLLGLCLVITLYYIGDLSFKNYYSAKLDQRNGRLHRILQKNDVNVHYLITEDTIEENIFDLLQNKRNVRKEVLYEM